MKDKNKLVRTLIRISLGIVFLWTFLDKGFGLGRATPAGRSWIDGVAPVSGFTICAKGSSYDSFFNGLVNSHILNWLFMLGLLLVGLSLIFGVATRLFALIASIALFLLWLAKFPPADNPIVSYRLVYALVLFGISQNGNNTYLSLNKAWSKTVLVKKFPILA